MTPGGSPGGWELLGGLRFRPPEHEHGVAAARGQGEEVHQLPAFLAEGIGVLLHPLHVPLEEIELVLPLVHDPHPPTEIRAHPYLRMAWGWVWQPRYKQGIR